MGSREVMLVVVLACVALTLVESTAVPESVLRLFGVGGDVRGEACGPQVDIETPACQVVESRGKYELRKYMDTEIWAETLVANSSYEGAAFTGFYRCFNFISGKNSKNMKIEMTGPVHISPAPDAKGYKVAFFVPSRSEFMALFNQRIFMISSLQSSLSRACH
ncbi:hypothetical protein KC19_6G208200 [Ceratodon purpureus]|uniref:Uncharacterized protein n=1 Tax=Ceratodon purpureus TaxID=3225 RepID=A0A8T0HJU5_CERPU|nr:hypothetical protein KC19_6G208200 [Ceratodon purpureus]